MLGHLELACATAMYAMGIVAQSVAARRAHREDAGVGLLARLVRDRLYLIGFAGQVAGFVLAFLSRATLPLYLVQAGSSCAVGLATLFGVAVLGWRVRAVEVATLVVMALGLVLLVGAATPSVAHDIPAGPGLLLLGLPLLVGFVAARLTRQGGVVSLAVLAGAAFAVVAVCGRSVADEPLLTLPLQPLAWLLVAAALLGQACLSVALSRGSATSTVASMDAVTVVLTSVIGIAALGDRVVAGREWAVGLGLVLVLAGVLVLGSVTRVAPAPPARVVREAV